MNKKKISLKKGYVLVYDFDTLKVHNYNTLDPIDDQVILLEKNNKLVVIESPSFYENNTELEDYIKSLNVNVEGVILSYHIAGGTFLKDVKKYTTKKAYDYGIKEDGKALIDKFTNNFGDAFDKNTHQITDYIKEGKVTIADITMNIIPTSEAFDIEIEEINSIYTHMLGSNCHSIIMGKKHANSMIDTLKGYLDKNYNLILTSHYVPEDISAVKEKIAYLKNVISIFEESNDANEMLEKVKQAYPNYTGLNYLEMSVRAFFES